MPPIAVNPVPIWWSSLYTIAYESVCCHFASVILKRFAELSAVSIRSASPTPAIAMSFVWFIQKNRFWFVCFALLNTSIIFNKSILFVQLKSCGTCLCSAFALASYKKDVNVSAFVSIIRLPPIILLFHFMLFSLDSQANTLCIQFWIIDFPLFLA